MTYTIEKTEEFEECLSTLSALEFCLEDQNMAKKKISKKQEECFDNIPIVTPSKEVKVKRFNPSSKLRDKKFVALALFEALSDGDEEAALEIINAYVEAVKKTEIAKNEKMATSTVYHALSSKGNPTLRTVAKVLHAVA